MKVAVTFLVVLGVVAAICASLLITTLTRPAPGLPKTATAEAEVEVLLAARDLPPMSVVDSSAVITKKVPKSQVPPNALLNSVQVVGKVITERMVKQQTFTKTCFAREGTGVYLAAAVPPGKRAISVSLSDWSGMAGLLYPGGVVDVLVSFKTLGAKIIGDGTEMMSTTLLQGVQVLAIGSQSIANDEYRDKETGALAQRGQVNVRMVTLLVDPKQAEMLQLASQSGSIALAMRNPLDTLVEGRRLTRAREIAPDGAFIGLAVSTRAADPFVDDPPSVPATTAAAASAAALWETLIIRGTTSETRTFAMPEEQHAPGDEAVPASDTGAHLQPEPTLAPAGG